MERYTKYKDSGIQWIGEIPEHWETQRFIHNFTFGKGLSITKADLKPSGASVISYGQIHSKLNNGIKILPEMIRYVDEVYLQTDKNCLLNKNDFVFADTSEDIQGSGNFAFNDLSTPILAGYHTLIVRPKGLECLKFIAFFMSSLNFRRQIQSLVNGVKVYSISKNILKKSAILLPPLPEQQAIASFLEKETSRIDNYIKQREHEISLLNELKQAEIANAVTKGLNPDAKMKDSGITWIGEIPEHWDNRYLFQVSREHFISNKNVRHQNLLSLSYGKIVNKDINTTDGLLPASFDTYQIVENGNIILRLTDLQNDHKSLRVGLVTQEGIITSAYVCLKAFDSILPKFLYYQLHSFDIKKVFYSMGGGLRQGLNYNELRKLNVIVPPKEEQQQIVEYIESRIAKIEEYITTLKSEIELIREYKQRLISDVVTGKIRV